MIATIPNNTEVNLEIADAFIDAEGWGSLFRPVAIESVMNHTVDILCEG